MANDSRRVSQLGITTTVSANDRVVVITNPATAAQTQTIALNNFINSISNAFPTANSTQLGVVKGGGNNIFIDTSGVISTSILPSGTYNITTITTATYNVSDTDAIIFADPYSIGSDITIILPIDTAIEGKEVFVKNISINPGWNVHVTTANGVNFGSPLIEDPIIHNFAVSYTLSESGEGETWIRNGNVWRHTATQRSAPIFYTTTNTYHQVVIQNANTGQDASGDFVVYNDQGSYVTGTGPYVDMGVDSSTYSNTIYSLFGPSDAYMYAGGANNLIIGTDSDNSIIFFANGTLTSNKIASINTTSFTLASNTLNVGTSTISANGYSYLHNGMKMVWGHFVCNTTSQVVFSSAFSTAVVSVSVTPANNVYVGANTPYVFTSNTTTANIYSASTTTTANCYYTAIGY